MAEVSQDLTPMPEHAFHSYHLDLIRRGKVELHAPTLQDVVQIDASNADGRTLLRVISDQTNISVERVDGEPLDIEINHEEPSIQDPRVPIRYRQKLFAEPVGRLVFQRRSYGRDFGEIPKSSVHKTPDRMVVRTIAWVAMNGEEEITDIPSQTNLNIFNENFSRFVVGKQIAGSFLRRNGQRFRRFLWRHGIVEDW